MTKVNKILIEQDVVEFMTEMGFHTCDMLDNNNPVVIFDNPAPQTSRVIVKHNGQIRCQCWNDEEEAERFVTTLDVAKSSCKLSDWLLLMHVGRILPFGNVFRRLPFPMRGEALRNLHSVKAAV